MKNHYFKILLPAVLFLFGSLYSQTLPTPLLRYPSDKSALQVPGTRLQWELNSEATHYKLKIYADSSLKTLVFKDDKATSTSRVAENLDYNTTYYWTVQSENATRYSLESKAWSFKTMPDNPHAVTSHPRLLITQNELAKLRSWANNSNPIYPMFKEVLNQAIYNYNNKFFPGGIPNPNWPDPGNTTWPGNATESYAEFFAFWSLIDPDVSQRPIHAKRARNLLMYIIDLAILGPANGVPFRDPQFMIYDRSRVYGEASPLAVDWIYDAKDNNGENILTDSDKAKIRKVFMRWCEEQLTAYSHPFPVGLMNDKKIQITNRWILNNYYSGHARNLTFMSLCMDEKDDEPINANWHYSTLGNSLRSYLFNATGAWLYGQYAQYEKPEVVAAEYGVPAEGIGCGSGGLSVEGSLYGLSIGWVAQQLLALKTSGWLDENIIGKQARLFHSDYWSRLIDGMLHQIAPQSYIPPQATYYGPIYPVANYGDVLRTWVTPELIQIAAPVGLIDKYHLNNKVRLDKCLWFCRNVLEGGTNTLLRRLGNTWAESGVTSTLYYYLLLEPQVSDPADPRPDMPTDFVDHSFHKILSRTDWTEKASWFNWQCHWTTINHQSGDGNQFEFYRNGEWLIKERSGYTYDGIGYTSEFHNTLALQNTPPANLQWYEAPTLERGAQWTQGVNAGDPTVITSIHDDFVYATGDATHLYNRPNQFSAANASTDIDFAVRSIIWLKPDHIIVYDRAKSKIPNRFKRFFLQFTAKPEVSGKSLSVKTPGNQQVYLTNLLPENAVLTATVSEDLHALALEEFTTHQVKIEDPANPLDIRFLNVIQAADENVKVDASLYVQSDGGTSFEGVAVHNTLVMFPKLWGDLMSTTHYVVPKNINKHIITGLLPNGDYQASIISDGTNNQVTIRVGNQIKADSGGVLVLKPNLTAIHETLNETDLNIKLIPNPFHEKVSIQYTIPQVADVKFELFDVYGNKMYTGMEQKSQRTGKHQFVFDRTIPNGCYFICLQIDGKEMKWMKLIKQ